MPITTVIFDLGGVLVQTLWERVTEPVSQMNGMSPDEVMDQIRKGNAYFPHMSGEIDFDEFHKRMMTQLGLNLGANEFLAMWNSILEPHPGTGEIVEKLKGHYRLSIGSNTDVPHFRQSREVQPIISMFDDVLVSYELGHCKPDVAFFQLGLEKLGVSPNETVFIDDLKDNVEAANSLGITGIQFLSANQLNSDLTNLGLL